MAELRKDPYTEEIGECKKLIRYLGLFLDNKEENKEQDPTKQDNDDAQDQAYIEFSLSSYKEVTRKRDREDDNIFKGEEEDGGRRRGKGKRRRRNRKRNR